VRLASDYKSHTTPERSGLSASADTPVSHRLQTVDPRASDYGSPLQRLSITHNCWELGLF